MSEYIECRNCDSPYCNGCNVNTLSKMLHKGAFKWITDDHHSIIPVAEVVAVKHGRWKLNKDGSGTCNQCHFTQKNVWDMDRWQRYCGVCGALMDGGADND
jgi:hypothetical protein